jgi:hypothetical protein
MVHELTSLLDVNTLSSLLKNEGSNFNENYRTIDANFGQDGIDQFYK